MHRQQRIAGAILALGLVAVLVVACRRDDDPVAPTYRAPRLERLIVPHDNVEADSGTTVRIVALVRRGSDSADRDVVFTTTAGRFERPGDTSASSIRVTAGSNDTAIALLVAPATPALAIVRATTGGSSQEDTIRFVASVTGITSLTMSAQIAPADGLTPVELTAVVPQAAAGSSRTVTFATTVGTLSAGSTNGSTVTVKADSSGRARVLLRSRSAELALVSASAGSGAVQDTTRFVRALPETILLDASANTVKGSLDSSVMLSAFLRRSIGLVSTGTTVAFSAAREEGTAAGTPIGQFGVPTLSDSTGLVTARFSPLDTLYRGNIRIIARTLSARGDTVQAATSIIEVQ